MERPKPSTLAWGGLIAGVAAYDILCPEGETLSERLDPLLENKFTKPLVIGAVGITALHLTNILPPNLDPFHRLTSLKSKEH